MGHPTELASDLDLERAGLAVKPITRIVQIEPLGGGTDDWARLSDVLTRYSGLAAVVMGPGLWTLAANARLSIRGLISGEVGAINASATSKTLTEPSIVCLSSATAMIGAPMTPSPLTALSDGAVLSATPVTYPLIAIHVDAGASGWLQLHNVASIPANAEVCVKQVPVTGPCTVEFTNLAFSVGAYWCLSSTSRVKTITAFTLCCAGVEV